MAALQEIRGTLYAMLHALDFTLDDAALLIGRLAEINRRLAINEPPSNR